MADINGTPGSDVLPGTSGDDTIHGGAGNDDISGNGGNDDIFGDEGDDFITVGYGHHDIDGGSGSDTLRLIAPAPDEDGFIWGFRVDLRTSGTAHSMSDFVSWRAAGIENVTGSAGSDVFSGGAEANILAGEEDGDFLNGGAGDDLILGDGSIRYSNGQIVITETGIDSAPDSLGGGDGNDRVVGGGGNDILGGGSGNDILEGGADHDGLSIDIGDDLLDGGSGFDTLSFYFTGSTYGGATASLLVQGTPVNMGVFGMDTLVSIENLVGTAYSDTLTGDDGSNWVWGTTSVYVNDTLTTNNDSLFGLGGDDLLMVGSGDHSLAGGSGIDTLAFTDELGAFLEYKVYPSLNVSLSLQGSAQASGVGNWALTSIENLSGWFGDDQLTGDGNANVLAGGGGSDALAGGAGNDVLLGSGEYRIEDEQVVLYESLLHIGLSLEIVYTTDILDGGSGDDRMVGGWYSDIYYVDSLGDVIIEHGTIGTDEVRTGLTAYTLAADVENLTGVGFGQALTGNGLANVIAGTSGNDTIDGGAGADAMAGGGGGDIYFVDNGGDSVTEAAGSGLDEIRTSLTSFSLAGLANVEHLTGLGNVGQSLTGNDAANILDGGLGADILAGGLGNDVYIVDNSGDLVNEASGAGQDEVRTNLGFYTLAANVETLTGTSAVTQELFGNALANSITGAGADDFLYGRLGNDLLAGGAGNDRVEGEEGNDILRGEAGNDRLSGGAGDDDIEGGDGDDSLYGESSFSLPGDGNDVLKGGVGNDFLDGGAGNDTLIGGTGNDVIFSGAGVDHVEGGDGNDNLSGGGGDFVLGGAGDDTISAGPGDTVDGGAGSDMLYMSFLGSAAGISADFRQLANNGTMMVGGASLTGIEYVGLLYGSNFDDVLIAGAIPPGVGGILLEGLNGNDDLTGTAGVDTIRGGTGNDIIRGGGGVDPAVVPSGDFLSGDDGDDIIYMGDDGASAHAGIGNDLVHGGNGQDFIVAGAGSDTLYGGGSNDTIFADDGDDYIDGGAGADHMYGGAGNDIFVVDHQDDYVQSDGGIDEIRTGLLDYTLNVLAPRNVRNLTGTSDAGQTLTGNPFANVITGGAGNDIINGGIHADTLIGGAGDDIYFVDDSGDIVTETAGQGVDEIRVIHAAYTLSANVEKLTGVGSTGKALTGNGLDNVITGGSGNDSIDGGAGADTMVGGTGNDVYTIDNAGDLVVEVDGAGIDEIRTNLGSKAPPERAVYVLPDFIENLTGTSAGAQGVRDNALNNVITMGSGHDLVVADAGGIDTISGGIGNDFVYHGDKLTAADTTNGGAGTDTVALLGDYGAGITFTAANLVGVERMALYTSLYLPGTGPNNYTITMHDANVAAGTEFFVTAASLQSNEILTFNGSAETNGRFTVHGGKGADTITGGAGGDFFLGNAGDDLLYGLGGLDFLIGGLGADQLRGGAGGDRFVYQSAAQSTTGSIDRIHDFQHVDRIDLSTIDANGNAGDGNSAFTFIGSNAFGNVAGQLRAWQSGGGDWFVEGDVNGDGLADLVIQVTLPDATPLGAGDFIL